MFQFGRNKVIGVLNDNEELYLEQARRRTQSILKLDRSSINDKKRQTKLLFHFICKWSRRIYEELYWVIV